MRALDKHPWRVDSEAKADLNFIRINATLLSESGVIGGLVIARKILGELYTAGNLTAPPAIVLANTRGTWDEGAPGRTILFADSHQGIPKRICSARQPNNFLNNFKIISENHFLISARGGPIIFSIILK